jgi:hypothetical protein
MVNGKNKIFGNLLYYNFNEKDLHWKVLILKLF